MFGVVCALADAGVMARGRPRMFCMRIHGIQAAILLFWLIMTGWLVRYEAFPRWFAASFQGYRSLLQNGPLVLDSWMQVLFKDTPIGYSHTWVDSRVESAPESFTLRNQTQMQLPVLGFTQPIYLSAGATLDAAYQLQEFFAQLQSSVYATRLDGRRLGQDRFHVRIQTDAGTQETDLTIPPDVILYSPLTEMAVSRLKPGDTLNLRVFDPLSLTVAEVAMHAVRREPMKLNGQTQDTTVIKTVYQGLETTGWVDAAGRMVRQETPFGLTLQACTFDEAMAFRKEPAPAGADTVASLAVPCSRPINQPRTCRKLTLRLKNIHLPASDLASPRQQVLTAISNQITLTVTAQADPATNRPRGAATVADQPWLVSSPALQADHPDVVRQAKTIVGALTNRLEAVQALAAWVHRHVAKQPAVSLPSALDVLQKRQGDCNEHTYLFVALARAAGIPAKILVGLVYAELAGQVGAYYYHAWPAANVGEWMELDPTFGQMRVDATHLALAEGELAGQMKLLGLIGRLQIEVLAEE